MPTLLQHRLDPAARLARLMCAEYGVPLTLEDTRPWLREGRFLEMDPSARGPILVEEDKAPVVGVLALVHTIEENWAPSAVAGLFPAGSGERAEVWRLLDWVLLKLNDEVTRYIVEEKIIKRDRRQAPDPAVLRVAKANLVEHLLYFNWIFGSRHWMAGDTMTLADFALAAHLSTLDYMGDVAWDTSIETRDWYARIKSRPAFRTLLNDRVAGLTAAAGYADLDF